MHLAGELLVDSYDTETSRALKLATFEHPSLNKLVTKGTSDAEGQHGPGLQTLVWINAVQKHTMAHIFGSIGSIACSNLYRGTTRSIACLASRRDGSTVDRSIAEDLIKTVYHPSDCFDLKPKVPEDGVRIIILQSDQGHTERVG